jgi:hypothetical protein
MLIPPAAWLGDRGPRGHTATHSERVLTLSAATSGEVDDPVDRAKAAGAQMLAMPAAQPPGCAGTFADPEGHVWMVTSTPPP